MISQIVFLIIGATYDTITRIRQQDIVSQIYHPPQLELQSYPGRTLSNLILHECTYKFVFYLQIITMASNSTLLCSDKIMVDSNGESKVYISSTHTSLCS